MSKQLPNILLLASLLVFSASSQAAFWAQQQTTIETSRPTTPTTEAKAVKPKPVVKPSKPNVSAKPATKPAVLTFEQAAAKHSHLNANQRLQLWQSYLRSPAATPCGKMQANDIVGDLYSRLEQYAKALEHYEKIIEQYPGQQCSNGEALIATALNSKGYVLGKLERKDEALGYFKLVPQLYKDKHDAEFKSIKASALSNTAEVSLIVGKTAQALDYAKQAKRLTQNNEDTYAIMTFLLWLMHNKTEQEVLKAINNLAVDTDYSWDWRDIPPVINQLPAKRQAKAKCFIDFFATHHSKPRVKACVDQY